jgi:hypothetical protein
VENVLNVTGGPWRSDGLIHATRPRFEHVLKKDFPPLPEPLPLGDYHYGIYHRPEDEEAARRDARGEPQAWDGEKNHLMDRFTKKPWRRKGLNVDLMLESTDGAAISHLVVSTPAWCENAVLTGLVWVWEEEPPDMAEAYSEAAAERAQAEQDELDARARAVELDAGPQPGDALALVKSLPNGPEDHFATARARRAAAEAKPVAPPPADPKTVATGRTSARASFSGASACSFLCPPRTVHAFPLCPRNVAAFVSRGAHGTY